MSEQKSSASLVPADENIFLVTGELVSFSSQTALALGYVVADDAQQAAREQARVQPNLRVSGVVSLRDLKEQVSRLEQAREGSGEVPVLLCGAFQKR